MISDKEADLLRMIAERRPMQRRYLSGDWGDFLFDITMTFEKNIAQEFAFLCAGWEYRLTPEPKTVLVNIWQIKGTESPIPFAASPSKLCAHDLFKLLAKNVVVTYTED